jgi:hypothetical protein
MSYDKGRVTHAFPFLEFMRSATSRLRARFGSTFCGSQALSKGNQHIAPPDRYSVLHMYRCSVDFGSAGSPKPLPKRSLEAMRAEAASILLEKTVSPPSCLAIKSQMSEGLSGGLRATG